MQFESFDVNGCVDASKPDVGSSHMLPFGQSKIGQCVISDANLNEIDAYVWKHTYECITLMTKAMGLKQRRF